MHCLPNIMLCKSLIFMTDDWKAFLWCIDLLNLCSDSSVSMWAVCISTVPDARNSKHQMKMWGQKIFPDKCVDWQRPVDRLNLAPLLHARRSSQFLIFKKPACIFSLATGNTHWTRILAQLIPTREHEADRHVFSYMLFKQMSSGYC